METLEIHSKSFVIKWVTTSEGSTITWQVKPIKKSINFGLYYHGRDVGSIDMGTSSRRSSVTSGGSTMQEKLQSSGLEQVLWHGKCLADELVRGSFTVDQGKGGVYAFVFDNTFSKQTAKKALFSQSVTPPAGSVAIGSRLRVNSVGSMTQNSTVVGSNSPGKAPTTENRHIITTCISDGRYLSGVMLKKRRKKLQGYGRRYFVLDNKYGLLNYYLGQKSSLLRGSMPLKLCVVTVNEKSREIIIDSGMEVWQLKALSDVDWKMWVSGLDLGKADISLPASSPEPANLAVTALKNSYRLSSGGGADTNWKSIYSLVEELALVTERAKATVPSSDRSMSQLSLNDNGPVKSSLWKQKPTCTKTDGTSPETDQGSPTFSGTNDVISDLSDLLTRFRNVVANQKLQQEAAGQKSPVNDEFKRRSLNESIYSVYSNDMFYDAEEEVESLVYLDEDQVSEDEFVEEAEILLESEGSDEEEEETPQDLIQEAPSDETDLYPLPLSPVERRTDIPESTTQPPSLIGLIRKNVGKDLTTIAMPVTCNEPITILQRYAEQLESCELLDRAANTVSECERVLLIAAFVVTMFQGNRVKMRSIRKPFNPLLGETYELVREDKGFRMIIEKVVHRPLIMAGHAESENWTMHYTSRPNQKSWGKSVEIRDPGAVRIKMNKTGEVFEFLPPISYLRNIIAGEKYSEPVGQVKVTSSSGAVAHIEFKHGGMFSGRSEDLIIRAVGRDGKEHSVKYEGKWTSEMHEMGSNKPVWKSGQLLKACENKYGFSQFTASLNEITKIEDGKLAPTDSRLRPDQRAYERGESDRAELLKLALEEKQRERRREMEQKNEPWTPAFFEPVGTSPLYSLKEGPGNYWNRRKRGDWSGIADLFTVSI